MRFRSTGLGKTELRAEPQQLECKGDLLILHVQTTQPVRWHIRAGIQRKDVGKLVRCVLTDPKVIGYFLSSLVNKSSSNEPEDF